MLSPSSTSSHQIVYRYGFLLTETTKYIHLEVWEILEVISECGLGGDTSEGEHGKTSVSDFACLHAHDFVIGLALEESEWVQTEISGFAVAFALGDLHEDGSGAEFNEGDSNEEEAHGALFDENVVGVVSVRDAFDGVNVSRETEGDSESTVGGQPSEPCQHGNSGVLDFGFTHPVDGWDTFGLLPLRWLNETGEVLWDGGEVKWVETDVTWESSVQSLGAWKERDGSGTLGWLNHGIPHTFWHSSRKSRALLRTRCLGNKRSDGLSHQEGSSESEGLHDYRGVVYRYKEER